MPMRAQTSFTFNFLEKISHRSRKLNFQFLERPSDCILSIHCVSRKG